MMTVAPSAVACVEKSTGVAQFGLVADDAAVWLRVGRQRRGVDEDAGSCGDREAAGRLRATLRQL
jgi:hypothetical protein